MVKTNSEYVGFFKYGQDDNQSNIKYEINSTNFHSALRRSQFSLLVWDPTLR